jgi:hypothetical protein
MQKVEDITPAEWRQMNKKERQEFYAFWASKGVAYFACLTCGFPMAYKHCENCYPSKANDADN